MSKEAIERVKGYCTKVDNETWSILMNTAFAMGILIVPEAISNGPTTGFPYAAFDDSNQLTLWSSPLKNTPTLFSDFISKLKNEAWCPMMGEIVEVSVLGEKWWEREFIAFSKNKYIAWGADGKPADYGYCRHRSCATQPVMTIAEAEKKLSCKIITS